MKRVFLTTSIAIGISLLAAAPALAMKRAPLQPSNALQPLPVDTHPNISGNVNSALPAPPPTEISDSGDGAISDSAGNPLNPSASSPGESNTGSHMPSRTILYVSFGALVLAMILWSFVRKLTQDAPISKL